MIDLDKGLLLEDSGILLEWGRPINKQLTILKEDKGDRTIFNWGEHKILNGLELELSQTFMHGDQILNDKFSFLDSWANGDKTAIELFKKISEHLTNELGQPVEMDEQIIPEKWWAWKQGNIKIALYLFEQHVFKLHLKIKNENV